MKTIFNWTIRSPFKTQKDLGGYQDLFKKYQQTLDSEEIGFFRLPQNHLLLEKTVEVFKEFQHKKIFVHLGIGGSALGAEMLISALGAPAKDVRFVFINNIDPDDLSRKLKDIEINNALFYVVSKSGTTAETVAAMSIVVDLLKQHGVSSENFKNYFVFCTDPEKGELRKISQKWNIKTLDIPSNVGGRFSVLSPVGFFPALFAQINVEALMNGAAQIRPYLYDQNLASNFLQMGLWLKDLHDRGVQQTVIMPYSSLLKDFSSWFVQLWAESLGKEGKGLTPIAAYGATDQHSQMQLFMEGPQDKCLMILEVEKFHTDFSLKNDIDSESFKNLSPFTLSELMRAELEGTLMALQEQEREVAHLKIPILNEGYLGQLILFFECLTVLMGKLLQVDPFNQPGVEAGKKYAKEWLKNHS